MQLQSARSTLILLLIHVTEKKSDREMKFEHDRKIYPPKVAITAAKDLDSA